MADNTTASSDPTIATDEVGGVHHPLVKLEFGVADTATLVSSADPLPTTLAEGLNSTDDAVRSVPSIPDGATYFKYGAPLAASSAEVIACPAGGTIVVRGVRVRSNSATPGTVCVFFDVNNDAAGFDVGTDQAAEFISLLNSATARPGSNASDLFEVGLADDDLRVEVTGGDAWVFVWGYTVPAP